jgi:hypothetical protein
MALKLNKTIPILKKIIMMKIYSICDLPLIDFEYKKNKINEMDSIINNLQLSDINTEENYNLTLV